MSGANQRALGVPGTGQELGNDLFSFPVPLHSAHVTSLSFKAARLPRPYANSEPANLDALGLWQGLGQLLSNPSTRL